MFDSGYRSPKKEVLLLLLAIILLITVMVLIITFASQNATELLCLFAIGVTIGAFCVWVGLKLLDY